MVDIKKEVIETAKALYEKNMLDSVGGNISARVGDKIFISKTKTSVKKRWSMANDDIIETDLTGKALDPALRKKTSVESRAHVMILNEIPSIKAVIHAHAPYLIAFASLEIPMPIVSNLAYDEGFPPYVRCIKGQAPTTLEEAIAITKYFKYLYDINPNGAFGCLIPYHAALVGGKDLKDAFKNIHVLEINARTFFLMEAIKSSNYYKSLKDGNISDLYDNWDEIQAISLEKREYYFERDKGTGFIGHRF